MEAGARGAAVTLAAACAALNRKVLLFPGALIPAAAALRLLSWWAHRAPHQGDAARVR